MLFHFLHFTINFLVHLSWTIFTKMSMIYSFSKIYTYHSIGTNFWSRFTHSNIIIIWKSILAHFIWPEKKIHIMKCFWHFPMKITKFSKVILAARLIRVIRLESKTTWYIEEKICARDSSDLLRHKTMNFEIRSQKGKRVESF